MGWETELVMRINKRTYYFLNQFFAIGPIRLLRMKSQDLTVLGDPGLDQV